MGINVRRQFITLAIVFVASATWAHGPKTGPRSRTCTRLLEGLPRSGEEFGPEMAEKIMRRASLIGLSGMSFSEGEMLDFMKTGWPEVMRLAQENQMTVMDWFDEVAELMAFLDKSV